MCAAVLFVFRHALRVTFWRLRKVRERVKCWKITELVKCPSGNGADLKKMRRNKEKKFKKCENNY